MSNFVLFLDFDGVLVTKFNKQEEPFDPVCIENLKSLIKWLRDRFDRVELVVISNWRFERTDSQLNDLLLNECGLHTHLQEHEVYYLDRGFSKKEGIKQYIDTYDLRSNQFKIIDDEYLGDDLAAYQIRTRSEDGIRDLDSFKGLFL